MFAVAHFLSTSFKAGPTPAFAKLALTASSQLYALSPPGYGMKSSPKHPGMHNAFRQSREFAPLFLIVSLTLRYAYASAEGVPCRTGPVLHWIDLKALKLKKDATYKENDKALDKVCSLSLSSSVHFSLVLNRRRPNALVMCVAYSLYAAATAGRTHRRSER